MADLEIETAVDPMRARPANSRVLAVQAAGSEGSSSVDAGARRFFHGAAPNKSRQHL
jgi:hypothetical protein